MCTPSIFKVIRSFKLVGERRTAEVELVTEVELATGRLHELRAEDKKCHTKTIMSIIQADHH